MGPKKKEREVDGSSTSTKTSIATNGFNGRHDSAQADHEMFLQAFEKPTQIYRYLRTRHHFSPVFMHRTLTYMKGRNKRNNKSRKGFKVEDMLALKEKKGLQDPNHRLKYMNLAFIGFHDEKEVLPEHVKVETLLLQIGHKKRKDVSSPIMQISVGTAEVPTNPSEDTLPTKVPTVSISTEELSVRNGQQGNSYVLLMRVTLPTNTDGEPQSKRRRLTEISGASAPEENTRLCGGELIVYDRHSRCLLVDGDYELGMKAITIADIQRVSPGGSEKSPGKRNPTWNSVDPQNSTPSSILAQGPRLKFRLEWANEPVAAFIDRPKPFTACLSSTTADANKSTQSIQASRTPGNGTEEPTIVRYHFLYNSSRRQQTEMRNDFYCPWCSLSCIQLQGLLRHLRLCHPRFIFTHVHVADKKLVRIDVSVNDSYDGSYSGNPHDLIAQPCGLDGTINGAAFGRQGPTRRTPITGMLIWRPRRLRSSANDPLHVEGEEGYEVCETQRPFITGHNRLYHHASTCLPIQAKELECDSEDETDPEWLRIKTCRMIDEFTDVNEGEKELMKLWNLHVLKYNYVGDCQMGLALQMFLENHGPELLKRNLYRNFILHLSNLYDFGIIAPATVLRTISSLQVILQKSPEHQELLTQAWLCQLPSQQS